jgi:hypothetical protein
MAQSEGTCKAREDGRIPDRLEHWIKKAALGYSSGVDDLLLPMITHVSEQHQHSFLVTVTTSSCKCSLPSVQATIFAL